MPASSSTGRCSPETRIRSRAARGSPTATPRWTTSSTRSRRCWGRTRSCGELRLPARRVPRDDQRGACRARSRGVQAAALDGRGSPWRGGVVLVVLATVFADDLLDALSISPESFRIAAGLVLAVTGIRTLLWPNAVAGPFAAVLVTPELACVALSFGADESTRQGSRGGGADAADRGDRRDGPRVAAAGPRGTASRRASDRRRGRAGGLRHARRVGLTTL